MNPTEHELEALLRRAPVPVPPAGLEAELIAGIRLQPTTDARNHAASGSAIRPTRVGWRRWLPWVAPGVLVGAVTAAMVVEQVQLQTLKDEVTALRQQLESLPPPPPAPAPAPRVSAIALPDERQEILRLRELADSLASEVAILEAARTDVAALRTAITAREREVSPETQELQMARERSRAIQCVNNLKQLGIAMRVWAQENNDVYPPDVLSMADQISTPVVLVCPGDESRQPATDWASFNASNQSYEYLRVEPEPGAKDPTRVLWRCPIHGNVCLMDGSVQMAVAREHPERLTWRNGGLYFNAPPPVPQPPQAGSPGGPVPANPGMSPELMRRYGLMPAAGNETPAANATPQYEMTLDPTRRYGLMPAAPSPGDESLPETPGETEPAPEP